MHSGNNKLELSNIQPDTQPVILYLLQLNILSDLLGLKYHLQSLVLIFSKRKVSAVILLHSCFVYESFV